MRVEDVPAPTPRVIKALTHKSIYVCLYMWLCLGVLGHGQKI